VKLREERRLTLFENMVLERIFVLRGMSDDAAPEPAGSSPYS
jgi:hypothetical protein